MQAGYIAVQSDLALDPDNALLLHESRYLEAENELWGSVRSYDDPAIYKALEQYAKRFEVGVARLWEVQHPSEGLRLVLRGCVPRTVYCVCVWGGGKRAGALP